MSASLMRKRLGVGVDGDELDAAKAELDHAVDGVDTATADADDLDHGEVVLVLAHGRPPMFRDLEKNVNL